MIKHHTLKTTGNILNSIQAILFDVDGVLTNGKIIIDNDGHEIKEFNVKDGQLLSFIQHKGILLGAISGRKSNALNHRLDDLKVNFRRLGVNDKEEAVKEFINEYTIDASKICYIGDDIIDLKAMKCCGLSVAPADASKLILSHVDIVTKCNGGEGVLREVIDKIIFESVWESDLIAYY